MYFYLSKSTAIYESPLAIFIILLIFSHLLYLRYFREQQPAVLNGSIIMALSGYALACLPQFNFSIMGMVIVALEIFVLWIYLLVGFLHAYVQGDLPLKCVADRMSMGTWVAGTAMMALLINEVEPTLHGFIVLLSMLAILLWVIYLGVMVQWIMVNIRKKFHIAASGVMLLVTTSTQAIVLLIYELFHRNIANGIYQGLILFGLLWYGLGFFSIIRYSLSAHMRHLIASWPNANTINHGALSITGLALLSTQVYPIAFTTVIWWSAFVSFVIVETFELYRSCIRIKMKGVRKGVLVYSASQWSRIFTFSVFYAFTFIYDNYLNGANTLAAVIADYGQYVVTALMVMEIIIVFAFIFKRKQPLE